MKHILILLALAVVPTLVNAEETTANKVVKAAILNEADADSAVTKAAKAKVAADVVNNESDTGLQKAAKLKALEEISK